MSVARHSNTSIDAVEDWDIDKFVAYSRSLARVLTDASGTGPGTTARTRTGK